MFIGRDNLRQGVMTAYIKIEMSLNISQLSISMMER